MVMKKRMCILMAMSVIASNMTFFDVNAEEIKKEIYTVEYNETDEFYKVTNPNNGKVLSYTSAELLEVEENDGDRKSVV